MKKLFIVSSLLLVFFANQPLFAEDAANQDPSLAGTNLSSNGAQNPFSTPPMDNPAAQPQPDTAGQPADDSDSW